MSKEAMTLALEALNDERYVTKYTHIVEAIAAIKKALAAQPAPVQEPVGCACRWNDEGDRTVTCERHQGWLEVIAEWADRAREAEAKLKALDQRELGADPCPGCRSGAVCRTPKCGRLALMKMPEPPQRKPLTEWQAQDIVELESWGPDAIALNYQLMRTIRRTEAAHGIKENNT